jgi:hypothetical protein
VPPVKPGSPDDEKGVGEKTSADADEPTVTDPEPGPAPIEKAPPAREEPVMPTAAEAAARRRDVARPTVVRTAFYLAFGSAALGVVTGIYLITQKQVMLDYAVSPDNPLRTTPARAENIVTTYLWLYMIQAVALGGFLTLFAYKAQEGVRRARMMMLIITLIMLLFHFYVGWAWPDLISGFCALLAIALMYLPSTREFFGPRQTIT